MSYETKTRKGYDGWEATSEAVIGQTEEGARILKLRTAKSRGGIASTASVCVRKNSGGAFAVETTAIFGDFYKSNINFESCSRVTEKAVWGAHERSLFHMNGLVEEAKAFYAALEGKLAA